MIHIIYKEHIKNIYYIKDCQKSLIYNNLLITVR
jgi:hypothetical protein